ncbi:hypothetical protein SAMD00019534_013850 [Acytostelium subglobosum LB1]|uniref:hypothetical protein n=1 Tax=Acytostelium subglobosum LB1 TaxID=1410327 RepID=UPI000644C5B9|nr:hypothetical protein SAMD00019534_013850 [Acytostelium subglobosum LB1]GAM18210.1 hypothetical protein SAMD00019534_013850 [Acytostelium subglobosum LB1]|eukprot:XP_012758806.1 hypothetical protein SAMD00019534_013850 [Acytostelium subglobosum LB1]
MDNSLEFKNFGNKILEDRKLNARLVFFCMVGSHSFNLSVETSDCDYFGVYALNAEQILSNAVTQAPLIDGHEPVDFVMYEMERFAQLLLKGNPKLIEPLFTERNCYMSEEWLKLRAMRHSFVSQQVIHHYVSYSKAQLGDAKRAAADRDAGHNKDIGLSNNHLPSKKLYHTVRLLHETLRMLDGGDPMVYLTGEHREYIMNIRRGMLEEKQVHSDVDALFKEVEEKVKLAKESNPKGIPLMGDTERLSEWLIESRRMAIMDMKPEDRPSFSQEQLALPSLPSSVLNSVILEAKDILENNGFGGSTIIYVGRSGSHLHNLARDDSKEDWIVVFVAPTDNILSLSTNPTRLDKTTQLVQDTQADTTPATATAGQRDTYVNGVQLFEVACFVSMLCQGNHRAVECFYSGDNHKDTLESDAWLSLKSLNINYLTSNYTHHCWGVAQGQLAKVKGLMNNKNIEQSVIYKHLYHAQRLLECSSGALAASKADHRAFTVQYNDEHRTNLIALRDTAVPSSKETLDGALLNVTELCNTMTLALTSLNVSNTDKKNLESNLRASLSQWLFKLRMSL